MLLANHLQGMLWQENPQQSQNKHKNLIPPHFLYIKMVLYVNFTKNIANKYVAVNERKRCSKRNNVNDQ